MSYGRPILIVMLMMILVLIGEGLLQAQSSRDLTVGKEACESDHWIADIRTKRDGRIVRLEDGSLWEVSDAEIMTTAKWVPMSEVVICGDKMINVDYYQSVQVRLLARGLNVSRSETPAIHGGFIIESLANDKMIINREAFKTKAYCFGFKSGDVVRFLSGSPSGECETATIQNLGSGRTCDVWCEQAD